MRKSRVERKAKYIFRRRHDFTVLLLWFFSAYVNVYKEQTMKIYIQYFLDHVEGHTVSAV